jgi:hypothetical protein
MMFTFSSPQKKNLQYDSHAKTLETSTHLHLHQMLWTRMKDPRPVGDQTRIDPALIIIILMEIKH